MTEEKKQPPQSVELGWGRTPIVQQFEGFVDQGLLENFDKDADAISRLRLRGYMTDSQHAGIVKKLTKAIGKAVNGGAK